MCPLGFISRFSSRTEYHKNTVTLNKNDHRCINSAKLIQNYVLIHFFLTTDSVQCHISLKMVEKEKGGGGEK